MIPKGIVRAVLDRDDGECVHCGWWGATVVDHRVNRGMGGGKVLNNPAALVAAHAGCNGAREDSYGNERASLIMRGIIVRPAATHRQSLQRCIGQPVQYPDGRWWFLTTDGRRVECTPPKF